LSHTAHNSLFRGNHQLHELLGDLRLQPLGVTFAEAYHVGHHAPVLAVRILEDFSRAGSRQVAPGIGAGILPGGVVHIARFRIGHIRHANARPAAVFRGPRGSVRNGLVAKFVFTGLEDEREIRWGRFAQSCHGSRKTGWRSRGRGAEGWAAAKKLAGMGGVGPRRPPERLSQPSTLPLKKSVRRIRLEVMPPCEWPTSQKALIFFWPTCS
jgi:hypothetical protein